MVHYQRYYYQQLRKSQVLLNDLMKGNEEDNKSQALSSSIVRGNAAKGYLYCKRARPTLRIMFLLSLLTFCSLICLTRVLRFHYTFPLSYSLGADNFVEMDSEIGSHGPLCSPMINGTICCDRSSMRTDICFMKGDIRTNSSTSSIFLYITKHQNSSIAGGSLNFVDEIEDEIGGKGLQIEWIKPYTRKWETSIMNTIKELQLATKHRKSGFDHKCDVWHDVPALVFSTGGYTGNVYHEFNDGILPLYISSQGFNKKVVLVIVEYRNWWFTKYGDIISLLSDYPPIDYNRDKRTHCFSEVIVGLRIHDELSIDPSLMEGNKTIGDFRDLLDRAYWPRIRSLIQDEEREQQLKLHEKLSSPPLSTMVPPEPEQRGLHLHLQHQFKKPMLTILSRNRSRAITNQHLVVRLAEEIGFQVEVLNPERTTELAKIYRVLNSSDAMMGVHGAAMTHFMFLKPGRVFIQVIPLGTEWAAETYYGKPAMKFGLKYIGYKILAKESSLYKDYDEDDPVLTNPKSVVKKGWQFTKNIYLDNQTVELDLQRFIKHLVQAYEWSVSRRLGQLEVKNSNPLRLWPL
ncbi:hypothetical protein Dimus_029720 [Dionaea muscipula]